MSRQHPSPHLSKRISYWLRHAPEQAGLTPDDYGWVSLPQLLRALQAGGQPLSLPELLTLNRGTDKVRWEIDEAGGRIRATHGHSIPVVLPTTAAETPPAILYHGTPRRAVAAILAAGLQPMRRQFVHLSATPEQAWTVAARHGPPVLLEVDAEAAAGQGQLFYRTAENVWLTSALAPGFLSLTPWHPVTNPATQASLGQELAKELMPAHALYPQLAALKLAWRHQGCDDTLFVNQQTGTCFLVHLTWRGAPEIPGYPSYQEYASWADWLARGLGPDQRDFYHLR